MKEETVNYLAVGVVVSIALALFLFMLVRMTGGNQETDVYYTQYQNVYGLSFGTPVFFQGFRIGEVRQIDPVTSADGIRFQVTMQVAEGWPLPADSVAVLTSAGLLSDVYIEIGGGHSAENLKPGDTVKGDKVVDMFAAFTELAEVATRITTTSLEPLLAMLDTRLTTIMDSMASNVPELMTEISATTASMKRTAMRIEEVFDQKGQQNVEQILQNMAVASEDVRGFSSQLDETRQKMNALIGRVDQAVADNQPDARQAMEDIAYITENLAVSVDRLMRQMNEASHHLNSFSREISKEPSRLIFSTNDNATKDGK